jgi:hypothetical protein
MFAVNMMVTHGPVNGCHVSYIYWFKIMLLVGVDLATSGQGGETWEGPPTSVPLVGPCYIYDNIFIYVFICGYLGCDPAGA